MNPRISLLITYSPSMSPNVCLSFSKRTFLSFLIFSLVTHPLSSSALVFLSYLILFCDKLSSCLNGLDGRVCLIIHMFFSVRSPEAKLVNLGWESSEVEFKRPIFQSLGLRRNGCFDVNFTVKTIPREHSRRIDWIAWIPPRHFHLMVKTNKIIGG